MKRKRIDGRRELVLGLDQVHLFPGVQVLHFDLLQDFLKVEKDSFQFLSKSNKTKPVSIGLGWKKVEETQEAEERNSDSKIGAKKSFRGESEKKSDLLRCHPREEKVKK